MSLDRKTLLVQRKRALQMLKHPDAPQELRSLAKRLYDKSEAILSLQDAQERKRQREAQRAQDDIEKLSSSEGKMNDSQITEDTLTQIFEEASALPHESVKEQLSYAQMFILADTFIRWAMESETTPDRAVQLIGWARSMCRLAEIVGEDWSPPEPEKLSVMGFIARRYEKHIEQTTDSVGTEG